MPSTPSYRINLPTSYWEPVSIFHLRFIFGLPFYYYNTIGSGQLKGRRRSGLFDRERFVPGRNHLFIQTLFRFPLYETHPISILVWSLLHLLACIPRRFYSMLYPAVAVMYSKTSTHVRALLPTTVPLPFSSRHNPLYLRTYSLYTPDHRLAQKLYFTLDAYIDA